ncbi:phosphoenolpyruvate carboxylase [Bdellovibrio sp. SKB1291214]|uniref:phosphoenolpyruvate carboxylase n=1 Tax=Bdellovibrio sp. SKB1291214 TaxID=1732569 RepID=UPI000B51A1F7|nr:phosphoenolpyruvate carboxylase [Bdellovibrio sp. SKB1291214]UYL10475.1 phosphoenolpyruvate carboxylase [Bdellovibrio sp. SKB1291214]
MTKNLPQELTKLVDWSVTELGKVIEFETGKSGFKRIEKIRRYIKSPAGQKIEGLKSLQAELANLSEKEQYQIAHAFALMLEIINSCEAAYRTYRLKIEDRDIESATHTYGRIIQVLTAHPTESRNPDVLYYFKKIQNLLIRRLEKESDLDEAELNILLKWAWNIPMSKQRKPSVMDEAEYIYNLSLQDDIIELFIKQRLKKHPYYIRTWVGGDKDGHPGVDDKTMLQSLNMSRRILVNWLAKNFKEYQKDLEPLMRVKHFDEKSALNLKKQTSKIYNSLHSLSKIQSRDSNKLHFLKQAIAALATEQRKCFGVDSPDLIRIQTFLKSFPGLVVPLELREDSTLVHEAVDNPSRLMNISRMMKALSRISPEHDPKFYVRGFVLSNCESVKDIEAGMALTKRYLGDYRLPVVPLFESAHSLENGKAIITEFLKNPSRKSVVLKKWSKKLEVMLGYSDSSKENGSFASRYLIKTAIGEIEKVISRHGITPIFFHGSGGSIERGGGSVQEQTDWWPLSALEAVKVTVQGEMIYRSFTSPAILERQLERFMSARDLQKRGARKKSSALTDKALKRMAHATKAKYQETLQQPEFLEMIEAATPYSYLKDLRMGSRPAKRQGPVQLKSLRAIPWVLCWTQTRTLFPTWWGVGSFWRSLTSSEKGIYKKAMIESPVFSTYIKAVGFTLEKMDLNIFALYLANSKLPQSEQEKYHQDFLREFNECKKAIREITGQKNLLWYRPWLGKSISLRSPLIHPLNVLQLIALKEKNLLLLRETVTGVASGMLTTG